MAEIQIFLNGEPRVVPDGINVAGLLELLSLPQQRIAVELNKNVVRRSAWPETKVAQDDRMEVVHFVGGG